MLGLIMLRASSCRAAAVALALTACTTGLGDVDASADAPPACAANAWAALDGVLPDRTCTVDADCTSVSYVASCCGNTRFRGVTVADAARFTAKIADCEAAIGAPGCGCRGYPTADDGTIADDAAPSAEAHCVAGRCTTTIPGSVPCGSWACTPSQDCVASCETLSDGGFSGATIPGCQYVSACDAGGACGCGASCNGGTCHDGLDGGATCSCP